MKKTVSSILVAVCLLGLAGCRSKKPAPAEGEKEWYRYISAFTSGTMFRKSPVRVLFVDNAGDPGQGRGGAARVLAGDRRDRGVDEPPRARLHPEGRAQARPGVQGRPQRRQDPRPAQGLRQVRVPLRRRAPRHGGPAGGPVRRGPGAAAGPGPPRPRRHGRHGGEGPGREGPRSRAGRKGPARRVEPRPWKA